MPVWRRWPIGYEPTPIERINHVTCDTAPAILREIVLPGLPSVPPGSFSGRGVVMPAGGRYLPMAYASVTKLREISPIPVEIWHLGPEEVSDHARGAFEHLEVVWRDAEPFFESDGYVSRTGWASKSVAIQHSCFRDVLFLDADCYPLVPPEELFLHPDYRDGLLVFPDIQRCCGDDIFVTFGLKIPGEFWEWEAGQFLVDKERHWKAIELYAFLNRHAYCFHAMSHGDKNLLPISALKLGEPFVTGGKPTWEGWGIRHYLSDGTPAFDHWMAPKREQVIPPPEVQGYIAEYERLVKEPITDMVGT